MSDMGDVRILDEYWACVPPDGFLGGAKVTVKSMDGNRLVLEAVEQGK